MTHPEFLLALDDLLELDPGTLKGDEMLEGLDAWDSLNVLSFIAFVDERFGMTLSPSRLEQCKTVNDLATLVGDQVTG